MSSPPVTPGRITCVWLIVRALKDYGELQQDQIIQMAGNTSLRGGGLPLSDGITLAEMAGFIERLGHSYRITESGSMLLSMCESEEPSLEVVRNVLLSLAIKTTPVWMSFSNGPSDLLVSALPEGWKESMLCARLIDSDPDGHAEDWWESVRSRAVELDNAFRNKIGRIGEMLTMDFEKRRLISDNFPKLVDRIRWISEESDSAGCDIISFFGLMRRGEVEPTKELLIEVKSSVAISRDFFWFYLTRNEWETAEKNEKQYLFYFWAGIDPDHKLVPSDLGDNGPVIAPVSAVRNCIPMDAVEGKGRWTECRVVVDLRDIQDRS